MIGDVTMKNKDMAQTTLFKKVGDVGYYEFMGLKPYPWLIGAFSTREGGVSSGQYATMNLSFNQGDDSENVRKNFKIIGDAIGVSPENMVCADQKHTNNVMVVGPQHRGMGVIKDRNFSEIDGLVTDDPGVCLVTSHADCVPLFFADPVNHVVGLAHSGWRGTVDKIATKMAELMCDEFETDMSELVCCIGPCICQDCYEVDKDVAECFAHEYSKRQLDRICTPKATVDGGETQKYLINLAQANREQLIACGLRAENIHLPDVCTSCSNELLFSHRASQGKRGGMCAFLMIRE